MSYEDDADETHVAQEEGLMVGFQQVAGHSVLSQASGFIVLMHDMHVASGLVMLAVFGDVIEAEDVLLALLLPLLVVLPSLAHAMQASRNLGPCVVVQVMQAPTAIVSVEPWGVLLLLVVMVVVGVSWRAHWAHGALLLRHATHLHVGGGGGEENDAGAT